MKRNFLLEKFIEIFKNEARGRVLDIGCGSGDYAYHLQNVGFDVLAADMDGGRFRHKNEVKFEKYNVTENLPFSDNDFDFVVLAEVIEHLENPYGVIKELHRVLRAGGKIILSTPNILNLKSRARFLAEGCWEYFREVPLEHSQNPRETIWNLHITPWRYHELEYLLHVGRFKIEGIYTSRYEGLGLCFLVPLIAFQSYTKAKRSQKKGDIDFARIHRIMLSKELLFGEHLIIKAVKV
ncbi:MAG: methyltransferase domain-containing protein [Candidatus Omnitrophica bacterium]|nr:methyltransferase domain-containing protein [Candidatus Omnitrophota bacterium]